MSEKKISDKRIAILNALTATELIAIEIPCELIQRCLEKNDFDAIKHNQQ